MFTATNTAQLLIINHMNWLSKEKSKYWDKAYQEYSLESGLSLKDLSNWIKVNPFVAVAIEDKAIEFMRSTK